MRNNRRTHSDGTIEHNDGYEFLARAFDYFALMKPRVMSLAVFTAFVGMMIAPGSLPPLTATAAMIAIAFGAGGAGSLNMWYDAEIDAAMSRTSGRPVPAGRLSSGEALGFGIFLSVGSVALLGIATNAMAATLLAFTIIFYAVIYTMWLKRATPHNIVIGGAAGAIPPMIGWASTAGTLSFESAVLFLIIFLWTPPHFWALALFKSGDYESANIPMMPNVAGFQSTRRQIFVYSLLLAPAGVLPWAIGPASAFYGLSAVVLGTMFVRRAYAVLVTEAGDLSMKSEKNLFRFSIVYLFLIFVELLFDDWVIRPLLAAGV